MIAGLGIDLVALERVRRMLERWGDRVEARLLTRGEREALAKLGEGHRRVEYVAGRIAAKEAASKALGVPEAIGWHDAEVLPARPLPPQLRFHGVAKARAELLGVVRAHLALTHDAGAAAAVVVLEREG